MMPNPMHSDQLQLFHRKHSIRAVVLNGSGRQEAVLGFDVSRAGHAERAGVMAGGMAGVLR